MGIRKRRPAEEPDEFGGGVKTIVIDVDGTPVRIVQLSQLPVMRVLPVIAEPDPSKQMALIMELLKSALMDPADWDKCVSGVSLEGLHSIMTQWSKTLEGR